MVSGRQISDVICVRAIDMDHHQSYLEIEQKSSFASHHHRHRTFDTFPTSIKANFEIITENRVKISYKQQETFNFLQNNLDFY